MMPEMDGIDTTMTTRNPKINVKNYEVLIIAMTAYAMKRDREQCLEAGMDAYIAKPIRAQKFYQILHEQLIKRDEEKANAK
jgi:CheY-like chemotaxis protein